MKTILRFGAADLSQNNVIDDYAKLSACEEYRKAYNDDFAVQDLRVKLRKQLPSLTAGFPDAYYFKSTMYLDHYDFATKVFTLATKSQLKNINSFALAAMKENAVCVKGEKLAAMPADVGARLDQPVTLEGLPIGDDRARALIKTMNAAGNSQRAIYARFSLMITFAPPITSVSRNDERYSMDAQLLNIEFFEDPEFTRPIWIYTRG